MGNRAANSDGSSVGNKVLESRTKICHGISLGRGGVILTDLSEGLHFEKSVRDENLMRQMDVTIRFKFDYKLNILVNFIFCQISILATNASYWISKLEIEYP